MWIFLRIYSHQPKMFYHFIHIVSVQVQKPFIFLSNLKNFFIIHSKNIQSFSEEMCYTLTIKKCTKQMNPLSLNLFEIEILMMNPCTLCAGFFHVQNIAENKKDRQKHHSCFHRSFYFYSTTTTRIPLVSVAFSFFLEWP